MIKNGKKIQVEGEKTKIFTVEYLIAVLFKAGRGKDKERIEKLIEEQEFNKSKLREILKKFKLYEGFIKEFGKI